MTAPTPAPDDADRRADRALFGGTPAGGTDGLPPDIDDEFARLAAALTAPPHDSPAPPAALVEAVKRDADAFFARSARWSGPGNRRSGRGGSWASSRWASRPARQSRRP